MTDGLENASQEYTAAQIVDLIKHQREAYKWEFLFAGANQDAILTGVRLNIPRANSVTYAACATGAENVMRATTLNVASFRQTGSRAGLHYTEGPRKAAVEQIDEERKGERAKRASAQEGRVAARQKAEQVAVKLKEMKLADAAELVRTGIEETLYYYAFPREHWRSLRTNNPLERILREVRRRGFAREHPDPAIAATRSGASGRGRNGCQSPQL